MLDIQKKIEAQVGRKVYLVGGAVRDLLMGIEPKDVDYVTLATPDDLLARGWEATGKSFPVFRHPMFGPSHELALGRTERKVAQGHNGFEWGLAKSLVDDLLRRDLTINAIAMDSTGAIIDPFNGRDDIKNKYLRPVSPAFAEDPLRSFRAARFAAKYGFYYSTSLLRVMREVAPELQTLSVERVREEMMKALKTDKPHYFFTTLRAGGSLDYWFPELKAGENIPAGPAHAHGDTSVFDHLLLSVKAAPVDEEVRLMALVHDFGKPLTPKEILPHHYGHENVTDPVVAFARRMNFSETLERKLVSHTKMHMRYHLARKMRPVKLVKLYRVVRRFKTDYLSACLADSRGRVKDVFDPEDRYLHDLFARLDKVDLSSCKKEEDVLKLLEKEAAAFKKEM